MTNPQWVKCVLAMAEEAQKERPDNAKLSELLTEVNQKSPVKAKAWSGFFQNTCPDCPDLKRDVAELKKEFSTMKAAAVIRQIALNIEHWLKERVVQHVGAQQLGLYSEALRCVKKAKLRNTQLDELLEEAADVLGQDGYAEMIRKIFPSGWDITERTIYNMKRFSDFAHPLTYEDKAVDEEAAKRLVSSMLPRKEGEDVQALEDCKKEGKRLIDLYASSRPPGSAFIQKI